MREELQKKVNRSVRLIQAAGAAAAQHGQPLEICYSGGKDSDVILELAKMSGVNYRAIYKNTTIDPPGTTKHAIENGVEVRRPAKTFKHLLPPPGFSGAIMILSLFRANTLKSSRRNSLKCPHQLQTHLPKAFLSSLCPFTRFFPL